MRNNAPLQIRASRSKNCEWLSGKVPVDAVSCFKLCLASSSYHKVASSRVEWHFLCSQGHSTAAWEASCLPDMWGNEAPWSNIEFDACLGPLFTFIINSKIQNLITFTNVKPLFWREFLHCEGIAFVVGKQVQMNVCPHSPKFTLCSLFRSAFLCLSKSPWKAFRS